MTRRFRLALRIGGPLLGALILLALAGFLVLRSHWFYEMVRHRIISEVERATGGKAELGSFSFDWSSLKAEARDFVIQGNEPAGSPPLLTIRNLTIGLKLGSILHNAVDLDSLNIENPAVHLIIHPDGSTNIPSPKVRRTSSRTTLETILDLAVKHFTLTQGVIEINSQEKPPFDLKGENLRAKFDYRLRGSQYRGEISMDPLEVKLGRAAPFALQARVQLNIEKNRIQVESARLETQQSEIAAAGVVSNLASPEVTLQYRAQLSLGELGRIFALRPQLEGRVQILGNADFSGSEGYAAAGDLHVAGLRFRQGLVAFRDVRADSNFAVTENQVDLKGLRLFGFVQPGIGKSQEPVRAEGRIAEVALTLPKGRLDLKGIQIDALGGDFKGQATLAALERYRVEGTVHGLDVKRILSQFGGQMTPWEGLLSGAVQLDGSLRGPRSGLHAVANLDIEPSPQGTPLQGAIRLNYDQRGSVLDLGNSYIALPATRLAFSGILGRQLRVSFSSRDLNDLLPAIDMASSQPVKSLPVQLRNGEATFDGEVSGKLDSPAIRGRFAANNFILQGRQFDSLQGSLTADQSGLQVRNAILTRGKLRAEFEAGLALQNWKPEDSTGVSGSASIRPVDLKELLTFVGKPDIPVRGRLSAQAQLSGAFGNPQITADVEVAEGQIDQEPFDSLKTHIRLTRDMLQVSPARWSAGDRQIRFQAEYRHDPGRFEQGRVEFHVSSSRMDVGRFRTIASRRPDLKGTVQLEGGGAVVISPSDAGKVSYQLAALNGDVSAQGLRMNGSLLGDVRLAASTTGSQLSVRLDSNVEGAGLHGEGRWHLSADYPGTARISFSRLDIIALAKQFSSARPSGKAPGFTGFADGKLDWEGPAFQPNLWAGSLVVSDFQLAPDPGNKVISNGNVFSLRNAGPIEFSLQKSVVRVKSARFVGRSTNLSLNGTVSFQQKYPLDLRVNGRFDLASLQDLDPEITSSGFVDTAAEIRGTFGQPQIGGHLKIDDADFGVEDFPNSLSHVRGSMVFTGTRASIEELTAESGGGNIALRGFVGYESGEWVFRLHANAKQVRIRTSEGVSAVSNATLNLAGTGARSLLSGTVTVLRTGFNPRTDFSSMLAKSAEPVRTPSSRTGLLGGMQFDVQIQTAPDVTFESSLAQNVLVDANMRLRGSPSNPALLGRILITQGQLTFFGTRFSIDQGTISFYNPVRIEPILNVDLETKARGIDVTLTVSGPLNKLNLTPRSDPPLSFSEIVALLATGRSPTSDLNLSSAQTVSPQSWQQLGASALLGQAIANPMAGRLSRFFGVTKLKIDPTLTGVENNPQARITIEQQVTPDITFTYITDVTSSNPLVVRVEWSVSKIWSFVALREENGLFGLDLLYKRRF